ncbi:hypothetical protein [Methyloraptor flagellatus]|uniref:Uncharacterized protein n=1 Tax=Methyloraptor flagellatus TaxID=3162530 RepID=A0AAU7X7M4_9HYPH
MKITAKQIADWADGKDAQAALPRYVRRLIHDVGSVTQVAMPAGDLTSQPGWDGALVSAAGNAWVPEGRSFWELSCEAQITHKANTDYDKRTRETPQNIRRASVYVAVTGRVWPGRAKWVAEKLGAGEWADVRAYDAGTIEEWLENTPAVKLEFGDEIGLTGHGVEDLGRHWRGWASQTEPQITPEALFVGREAERDRLLDATRKILDAGGSGLIRIRADSVEEAAAFAAASLASQPDSAAGALVVNEAAGWRFVDQNSSLKIAIAARPDAAGKPTVRPGTVVIVPYASGDMEGMSRGGAEGELAAMIALERPDVREFETALSSIGLDESDAKRLASATGRSWSVYRRRRSTNPAIRRPLWLDAPQAAALSTVCLLGSWVAGKPGDRAIVAELAGRPYEQVEADLRHLAQTDDAPILVIGEVWKAKSPLELLDLFGARITRNELDRFFQLALRVLSSPDPELELPDDQRYAAQIYGKVRAESGLLIRAICDTLIKLAVRGPSIAALAAGDIEGRVERLVTDLLSDATGERWLALSSQLPDLAEAAPMAFIRGIERSLAEANAPVLRLLTETGASSLIGRCWHAGLLWALERIAWAPERFTRVALLLARLSRTEIKGNWSNSPRSTLAGLFRSWLPQTAANLEQRIAALDALIGVAPDVASDLLLKLVDTRLDVASASNRPEWRDDDAGVGRGVSGEERDAMLVAVADRVVSSATGHPDRLVKLIEKIDVFDQARIAAVLALFDDFAKRETNDDDREKLRAALRQRIHKQFNYGQLKGVALARRLARLESLYEQLTPRDPVSRSAWLFADPWPQIPVRVREIDHLKRNEWIDRARLDALREIHEAEGWDGIDRLVTICSGRGNVGATLTKLALREEEIADWIVRSGAAFDEQSLQIGEVRGALCMCPTDQALRLVKQVLATADREGWTAKKVAHFLTLAEARTELLALVEQLGTEVEDAYWRCCHPRLWRSDTAEWHDHVVRRLLNAGRPKTAFLVCQYELEKVGPSLIAEMLEGLVSGVEADGVLPDLYSIGVALDRIEESGRIERDRLVRLEFALIRPLGLDAQRHARTFFEAIMSDPKLFTELICLVYRSTGAEPDEPSSEEAEAAAAIAWSALHSCQRSPGTMPDGRIDPESCVRFVDDARALCGEAGRLRSCDSSLGQILAHIPPDEQGSWPPRFLCDLLDRPELEEMRDGFSIGIMNKRGVVRRSLDEGGTQERELASRYREFARPLAGTHVRVFDLLEKLASHYEKDGLREDLDRRLRREGR